MTQKKPNLIAKYFSASELSVLIPIIAAALILRLLYIFEIQNAYFMHYFTGDQKIYRDWALQIANNGNWTKNTPFFMAPAYPYFLAVIYKIFGDSNVFILFIQAILNIFSIIFVYLTARKLHSNHVGYIAAFIGAFYTNYIIFSGSFLSEHLQVFVYSILIYYLSVISTDGADKKRYFYLGLIIGSASWLRGNVLLFAIFIAVYLLFKIIRHKTKSKENIRKLILISAGVILSIMPVTLHNVISGKDFVLLTSNGGINFYIGNNQNSLGVFKTPTEFDFDEDMTGIKYAQGLSGKMIKPSEASSFWYGKGLDFIKSNPTDYILLEIKKLFYFFGEDEFSQSSTYNSEFLSGKFSRVLELPLFGFFFLTFFSIPGIIWGIKNKKYNNILCLFFVSYLIASLLFFVNGRMRMAITPLMLVFAAYGIYETFNLISRAEWKKFKIPSIILIGFIVIYYFFIPRPTFTPYDSYLDQGNYAYDNKDYKKAIEYFKKSLFYRDYYLAYVNLGNAYAQLKEYRSAIPAFQLAIKRKPDYYLSHFNLGFAFTQLSLWDKAIDEYLLSIKYKPEFAGAYRNIGIVYYINEKYEDALYYFNTYLTISNDEITKNSVKKDIEAINEKLRLKRK